MISLGVFGVSMALGLAILLCWRNALPGREPCQPHHLSDLGARIISYDIAILFFRLGICLKNKLLNFENVSVSMTRKGMERYAPVISMS